MVNMHELTAEKFIRRQSQPKHWETLGFLDSQPDFVR
jgi:hypothetical protein